MPSSGYVTHARLVYDVPDACQPTTELETSVDRLLKTARLREEDIAATEELKMNHLTPEEVQARRAELRQMRELMFRAEAKAKRVSKIKSKTYRRIRKKERAKLAEKLGDAEGDDLDEEEAQLKREVERARERATLRHKHTGKWAKSLRGRGELAEDQQRDINDMLDRGEKLRRRIQGIGSDEDDAGSDSDTNSEADVEDLKASGFNELHALRTQAESEPSEGAAKKGVFNMKFMKDSMAAGMQNVNDSIDHLINDLEGNGIAAGSEAPYDAYRGHGRVSFHPSQRVGLFCILICSRADLFLRLIRKACGPWDLWSRMALVRLSSLPICYQSRLSTNAALIRKSQFPFAMFLRLRQPQIVSIRGCRHTAHPV